MKKAIAILLLAVMVLSLAACKGKKEEEKGIDATAVVGRWLVKDCKPLSLSEKFYGTTLELKEGGTFTWTKLSGQKVDAGKYRIEGFIIFLNDKMFSISIDGDQMELGGSDGTLTMKKMG